jgi:hypothetical protein
MQPTQAENYPFVKEFVTDNSGQVLKVVLQLEDYQRLLESMEDQGLYRAMQDVRNETPLSFEAALQALDADES